MSAIVWCSGEMEQLATATEIMILIFLQSYPRGTCPLLSDPMFSFACKQRPLTVIQLIRAFLTHHWVVQISADPGLYFTQILP